MKKKKNIFKNDIIELGDTMNDANKLLKLMVDFEYGYVTNKNEKKYFLGNFSDDYKLQSPKELSVSKLGVCWDQVEFQRNYYSELKISVETYFIVYYDGKNFPTHTFMIVELNEKYLWIEHAWEKNRGVHEFKTKDKLLLDVKNKFIDSEKIDDKDYMNLCIYLYDKPKFGINCLEFYKHCEKGINIKI